MRQQSKQLDRTHNLPPQPTPFIGRTDEKADITCLLTDPTCRLLTLVGAGGIGKTRLAIQVAVEVSENFSHGVYFVPLQPVRSSDFLVSAMTDAVGLSLSGQEDPEVRLLSYLHDKEMLLVPDSFEHLLWQGGATLIARMLQAAPSVKLLVTSREVLNLREEWTYPIEGLPFPEPSPSPLSDTGPSWEGIEEYSAIQLFIERARRACRDFSLADELAGVIRVCQLVEGMPLGLELAASWTRTLSCAAIATEIQQNLGFLATALRNVPAQHQSMQAVFDHSWQLLTEEERDVFRRLSVFRSGFRREAAEQVAGASLLILSTLVDKSLLRSEPNGRYQIHELLRQYAEEELKNSPEEAVRVCDLHTAHYADFLQQRAEDVTAARQCDVIQEVAAELENVRAAWWRAVEQSDITAFQKAAYTFNHFCDFQGRFQEGARALEGAMEVLEDSDAVGSQGLILAELLVFLGFHYVRLGRFENARAVFERSQAIFHGLDVSPPPGFGTDPLVGLGLLAHIFGNYGEAEKLGDEARRLHEARSDKQNLQIALYTLTNAAFAQGHYEAAFNHAQQAYALTQETNNRWMMAYILSDMGNVARALGDHAQATQHYQASYAIKQEFNDPEGMAAALNHLARTACQQEMYREADKLYRQSLVVYEKINDKGGLATSLSGLGTTSSALGDYEAAQRHFHRALQIVTDIQFVPLMLSILIRISDLLLQTGQQERGVELLVFARHHPASDYETKDMAQQRLHRCQGRLPPELFAAAAERGQNSDLEAVATTLLAELLTPGKDHGIVPPAESRRAPASEQPLVEPLTARELEVLQLIAEGLTNQQVADRLVISVGTVKWYTSQIYGKLNVSSRTQAVARARELRLLS